MVRKKDPLWVHAIDMNGKFECKYCKRVFSGGLTRLKFHLSGLKEWRDLSYSKTQEAISVTGVIQNDVYWSEAKELIQALEPLVRILRLVDGEGSTSGMNTLMMQNTEEKMIKDSDPIDLSKLTEWPDYGDVESYSHILNGNENNEAPGNSIDDPNIDNGMDDAGLSDFCETYINDDDDDDVFAEFGILE
ncbi:unnamed protein product [Cuscuta campestris]|uniref:BED-type domain-containing protein n=1 Tax=Cuscuta campestris TaxID=132261 RepID=A0A484MIW4_9ASTE|nr:unnamed protein product [Cuscuta campestris]